MKCLRELPKELLVVAAIFIFPGLIGAFGGSIWIILILAGNSDYPLSSTLY